MEGWKILARGMLVLCVVVVCFAVISGLRERTEPAPQTVVERSDPAAIIETRGSRISQT